MFGGACLPRQANLSCVLPATLDAVGLGHYPQQREQLNIPRVKAACVVLVDGLGYHQLACRLGHAQTLRKLGIGDPITTVVPSTTAAGITSFGTGAMPGSTAMLGYAVRSPQSDKVFSLISWKDVDEDPLSWQTHPTLFEEVSDESSTVLIQPKKFIGSGLTLAALRGARVTPAETLDARVDAAVREIRSGTKLAYLYWGDIDSTGHKNGWQSDAWVGELEHFDASFGRLLRSLPKDTLVILTADHGMIDVANRLDIASIPELTRGVDDIAGEPRAVQLYTDDIDGVRARWCDYLGDAAWVVTRDEIIASGVLGPTSDFAASIMGDVWVFSKDRDVIVDSRVQTSTAIGLIGVHGSLTEQEMEIPLIVEVI